MCHPGLRQRLPAGLRDLHTRDLDCPSADNDALAMCGRESGMHKLNYLFDSEAMREKDRLGTAVPGGGKQLERTAAVGLGAAPSISFWLFGIRRTQHS
jgi:hypothetical protein